MDSAGFRRFTHPPQRTGVVGSAIFVFPFLVYICFLCFAGRGGVGRGGAGRGRGGAGRGGAGRGWGETLGKTSFVLKERFHLAAGRDLAQRGRSLKRRRRTEVVPWLSNRTRLTRQQCRQAPYVTQILRCLKNFETPGL